MALFLAVAVALVVVAWPLVSYTYPTLLHEIPFRPKNGGVITPQLSAFIEKTMALHNITGLSIAVVPKNGPAEFHALGYRTEDGDKVTSDTLFHIGSVSKAFCSTALGLLLDDFAHGKNVTPLPPGLTELSWHTRLSELLPDWQLMDEWATEKVNLRDILSHVSGVPRHDTSYGPLDTPQEMITRLKYLRPAFELREQFSYNNIMYMVASHVIATYSGQSYTSFVEERIFTPLGMTSSTFSPFKAEGSGKFTQGWTKDGRRVPATFPEDAVSMIAGPGGVISNVVDMSRWISMWIGQGVFNNQTIIPLSVYRNTSYSYAVCSGHPSLLGESIAGYGLGWLRTSYRGHDIIYHTGSVTWASTRVSFLPTEKIGITLLANGVEQAEALELIQSRILDSALHLNNPSTPTSPPSPNVTTTKTIDENLKLSLDAFAGTYSNPGHGTFTLCGSSDASSYCTMVRSDFSAVDNVRGTSNSKDLFAEWPRLWTSHVRLRHQQGHLFEIIFTSLYPNGYGKDTTPFESLLMGALAEFVIEDGKVVGFGISDTIDELTERARKHETVQARAEAWFEKV